MRNELDPQRLLLPVDKIKIFEVKGHEIPLSALPAGSTHSEWTTWVEMVQPQDLERGIADYKHKILGVKVPKEIPALKQLETRIAQNPSNEQLKEDFNECLLKASTTEFLQIREFKADSRTQKKYLEVVRTCANKANSSQAKS